MRICECRILSINFGTGSQDTTEPARRLAADGHCRAQRCCSARGAMFGGTHGSATCCVACTCGTGALWHARVVRNVTRGIAHLGCGAVSSFEGRCRLPTDGIRRKQIRLAERACCMQSSVAAAASTEDSNRIVQGGATLECFSEMIASTTNLGNTVLHRSQQSTEAVVNLLSPLFVCIFLSACNARYNGTQHQHAQRGLEHWLP